MSEKMVEKSRICRTCEKPIQTTAQGIKTHRKECKG